MPGDASSRCGSGLDPFCGLPTPGNPSVFLLLTTGGPQRALGTSKSLQGNRGPLTIALMGLSGISSLSQLTGSLLIPAVPPASSFRSRLALVLAAPILWTGAWDPELRLLSGAGGSWLDPPTTSRTWCQRWLEREGEVTGLARSAQSMCPLGMQVRCRAGRSCLGKRMAWLRKVGCHSHHEIDWTAVGQGPPLSGEWTLQKFHLQLPGTWSQ